MDDPLRVEELHREYDERQALDAIARTVVAEDIERLVLVLGYASRRHPFELQRAIADIVPGFAAISESAERAHLVLAKLQQDLQEARHEIENLREDIERIERHQEAITRFHETQLRERAKNGVKK